MLTVLGTQHRDPSDSHRRTIDQRGIRGVEVGQKGRMVSITDLRVEGRRDRVDAFMVRPGLTREPGPPPS